jgi:hypothetical protein
MQVLGIALASKAIPNFTNVVLLVIPFKFRERL